MGNIMQGVLIVFFEVICCQLFFSIFLTKYKNYRPLIAFFLLMIGLTLISVFGVNNLIVKGIFIILYISVIMCWCYNTKIRNILLLVFIYYSLVLIIDYLIITLVNYITPNLPFLKNGHVSTYIGAICKFLLFLMILGVKKTWSKHNSLALISKREYIKFLFFPLFTIVSVFILVLVFQEAKTLTVFITVLFISIGLITMNFLIFSLMGDIIKRESKIQNSILAKEHAAAQLKIFKNMKANIQKQKSLIHDFKNQMICMQGLLAGNKTEEAKEYAGKLTGTICREFDNIKTSHVIIDVILNQKYLLAKENNIIMPIISNNLAQVTLQDDDIVILLSNLIDNAIEACQKVEADRYIKLKLVWNTNEFILSIQNSIKEESFNTDSVLLTTKSSRSEHGIGLQNVAEILNKYQGISSITCKNYCFYFSAVFPQNLEE